MHGKNRLRAWLKLPAVSFRGDGVRGGLGKATNGFLVRHRVCLPCCIFALLDARSSLEVITQILALCHRANMPWYGFHAGTSTGCKETQSGIIAHRRIRLSFFSAAFSHTHFPHLHQARSCILPSADAVQQSFPQRAPAVSLAHLCWVSARCACGIVRAPHQQESEEKKRKRSEEEKKREERRTANVYIFAHFLHIYFALSIIAALYHSALCYNTRVSTSSINRRA